DRLTSLYALFFFFQAEDGIRDDLVTGVQTSALPIFPSAVEELLRYESPIQHTGRLAPADVELGGRRILRRQAVIAVMGAANRDQIGRASCRKGWRCCGAWWAGCTNREG